MVISSKPVLRLARAHRLWPQTMESDDDEFSYEPFSSVYIPRGLVFDAETDSESAHDHSPDDPDPDVDGSNPPIQHAHTHSLRERLGPDAPER